MFTCFASVHAAHLSVSPHSHPLQSVQPHRLKALPVAFVAAAGLSFGVVGTAVNAATIVVNSSGDSSGNGVCTLRDAVYSMQQGALSSATNGVVGCTLASGSFGAADTITFANSVVSIGLTQSTPVTFAPSTPQATLLLQGRGQGGVTISRSVSPTRAGLILQSGGGLTLNGITLTGGFSEAGGAVQVRPVGVGTTTLELNNSVITGNMATRVGGGIYAESSGNTVAAVITTNSTISNNRNADNTSIYGAGIALEGPSVLTMTGSTVSGNGTLSTTSGGAIYAAAEATVTLTHSTISGNTARCRGAGLYSARQAAAGVTLTSVTLTANFNRCSAGSGLYQIGGRVTLNNTVVAGNTGADLAADGRLTVTGSNNLVPNFEPFAIYFADAFPLRSDDPLLGPLSDNGGATFTHALLSGSPAIDAGSSSVLTTDQRGAGFPRLSGSAVDIGAFEFATLVNGACGSASSSTPLLVAPTTNLCSPGIATPVSGTGPWTWFCNGSGGGSSTAPAACSVPIQTWSVTPSVPTGASSGSISPANAVSVNNNASSTFTLNPAAAYTTTSVTGCNGTLNTGGTAYTTGQVTTNCNVVASFALTAINGACGSASGGAPRLVAPSANLCSTGTATTVNGNGPWTWGCNGNATGASTLAAACSAAITTWSVTPSVATGANSGSISPAATVSVNNNTTSTFTLTPASGYITTSVTGCGGTFSAGATTYTTGPVTASCNVVASLTLIPVNGACGTASGGAPGVVAPSANLCSTGSATTVNGSGPWTWGCNGNATGTSTSAAACSTAIKTWTVTPSVSGGNGAIAPSAAVSVNNNAATSFTVTPNSGYNIASVIGCGGTRNGAQFSIVAVTADCSVVAMFSAKPGTGVTLSGNNTTIPNGTGAPARVDGTDFGAHTTGQNTLNSFVLANNGTIPFTITSMSFSGTNAADFTIASPTAFPVIVNAGTSTTFSVRFTPSAPGLRSAALAIAFDDGVAGSSANQSHIKAMATLGFAVQGVGLQDIPPSVPVPTSGLGALMASLLGLLLTGFAALRRGGRR